MCAERLVCRSTAAKSVGVVATPASPPGSRLGRGHAPRPSVCRPRSARRPDPGARRVSTRAGPQAGPGRRTARRASPRTRPDAPPPRPATARPSESRAPPLPRHRPGRQPPEVPRPQGSRCERGTPSAPAIRQRCGSPDRRPPGAVTGVPAAPLSVVAGHAEVLAHCPIRGDSQAHPAVARPA